MNRTRKIAGIVLSMAVFLSACGGGSGKQTVNDSEEPKENTTPITLFMYTSQNGNYANEAIFEEQIGKFVKQKFPYITIEHIHKAKGQDYPEIITSGHIPDLILENPRKVNSVLAQYELEYDIGDLIKKYKFDTSRIDPAVFQQIKNSNPEGKVYGLPFLVSHFLTFYNKNIFDKFGVPYLKDGMTWDEIYDVSKKLARVDNNTEYIGFAAHPGLMMQYNQLSVDWLDAKQDKAAVSTDAWKRLFTNLNRFYEIPNNKYVGIDDFAKGNVGIGIHVAEKMVQWPTQNPELNLDMVSPPLFKDVPNTGFQPNSYYWFITQQSKYKDQAFQVMAYLLSDEVQKELSKKGMVTALKADAVRSVLAQDLPFLKGKNTQAAFFSKHASPVPTRDKGLTEYYYGFTDLQNAIKKADTTDVNTLLRMSEEATNKGIETEKQAKKGK